jgi:tetratricopeptide (TPR) repeat protein
LGYEPKDFTRVQKNLLVLGLVSLLSLQAKACLNETRVLLNGKHTVSDEDYVPYPNDYGEYSEQMIDELKEMDSLWRTNHDLNARSDYGVLLVYAGRYEEAKAVFEEMEKLAPGRYTTAANLGTVYELLGNNEAALKWIRKAVQIDPASHDESEWLHVKILEVKINGQHLLTPQYMLGTTFGEDTIPVSSKSVAELTRLRDALYYQLQERLSFIKPTESIVAMLLFELGNVCAITNDVTLSLRIYDRAKEYGYQSEVFNKRYSRFLKLQQGLDNEYTKHSDGQNAENDNGNLKWQLGLVAVLLAGGSIWFFTRKSG